MIASKQIAFGKGGKRKPYDAEVDWIGFSVTNTADARNTDIVVEGVEWDSFSINIKIPSTSLVGYRACAGGPYIYYGCNRIGFTSEGTYRGGASFMGIADGISVPTDRFVLHESPSPTKPYWNIDGVEYPVARCANTGGVFRVFSSEGTSTMGYYVSSCKLFKNGETTLDLIPVRKGNIGYMYDRVSGQLFGNQGTGEFVLGPDIIDYTAKDYIQDGLVAMWDGIENAGWGVHDPSIDRLVDLSGGGHDMTFVGEHEIGDSYVYIFGEAGAYGTVDGVNFGTPVTQEIIICASGIDSYARFIGEQRGLVYGGSVYETGRIYGWGVDASIANNRVEPSQTYCQSLVVDSGLNASYFFNGELKGERAVSTASQYSGQTSFFNRTSGGRGITGNLYNCRLYNRALTAEEIAHNYEIDKARFGL